MHYILIINVYVPSVISSSEKAIIFMVNDYFETNLSMPIEKQSRLHIIIHTKNYMDRNCTERMNLVQNSQRQLIELCASGLEDT